MISGANAFTLGATGSLGNRQCVRRQRKHSLDRRNDHPPCDCQLHFNGTVAQVTGTLLPASLTSALTINNSAGVTLSQPTTVPNLTLTSGQLNLSGNALTIANGGQITVNNTTGTAGSLSAAPTLAGTFNLNYTGTSAITTGQELSASPVNLTVNNTAGVTLSAPVAVAQELQIASGGSLNLGGSTTCTAGFLSLDGGSSVVSTNGGDTFGPTGAHTESQLTGASGYVTVYNGSTTQFRSAATGNWNAPGTWQISLDSGTTWNPSTTYYPAGGVQVYLQSATIVTLTENEGCGNLNLCYGTTAAANGADGTQSQLIVATYALQLGDTLRAYYDPVGTVGNTFGGGGGNWTNIVKTVGSTGEIKVVGTSRAVTVSTWNFPGAQYSG